LERFPHGLYRKADFSKRAKAFQKLVEILSDDDLKAIEESSEDFREGFELR
jgi:hypothetical protein